MKKFFNIFRLVCVLFLFTFQYAFALNLGTNITIFDGQGSTSSPSDTMDYNGVGQGYEDQETEPETLQAEAWDLEGMFLNGTILSLVGQWDFINGQQNLTSGDIFIDLDGDKDYEFVFDVDWQEGKYDLFKIKSGSFLSTTYKTDSSPWRIDKDNSVLKELASGKGFASIVDNSLGFKGISDHNVVTGFDLGPILTSLDTDTLNFYAHFTMECGNDDMEGHGTVPEPATMLLMGTGLLFLGGISRKRIKKQGK